MGPGKGGYIIVYVGTNNAERKGAYINPHITDQTKSWANKDISDAELGLTRYKCLGVIEYEEGEGEEMYYI